MAKKKNEKETDSTFELPDAAKLPVEVRGLLLLAFALFLFLSLISFTDGRDSDNWLGLTGFTLAWTINYLFGLGSFLIVAFLTWFGWRRLWDQPIGSIKNKSWQFFLGLIAACMLLTVASEKYPSLGRRLGKKVYSQYLDPYSTIRNPGALRHNLGGVPFYYVYADIPTYNLRRLLNNTGVSIVFGTLGMVSLLLLSKFNLRRRQEQVREKLKEKLEQRREAKAARQEEGPIDRAPAYQRLALPLKNWVKKASNDSPAELPIYTSQQSDEDDEEEVSPALSNKHPLVPITSPVLPQQKSSEEIEEVIAEPVPIKKTRTPEAAELREAALNAQRVWNGDFSRYAKPNHHLLSKAKPTDQSQLKRGLKKQAEVLEETLLSFGIEAKVGKVNCGPTITSFEVLPAVGVKVQRIKSLEDDIALNLKAKSIRIIAPIPGKAAVGIEVPNPDPQEVSFRELLDTYRRNGKRLHLPVLLGKTVNGDYVISDLTKMPHCIIAGATGSGKSVCINTIVMSVLMTARPDEVRLLMVDPKKVELTPYTRLPHMLAPVITEPQGACNALNWLVKEMEKRYEILKHVGARNINAFNNRNIDRAAEEEMPIDIPEKFPFIVAIIDELADLMMVSSADIETPIARIAQMARAVGIHLILATQRPSREVITGLIKANFPTRICFKVSSRINSQIVLDDVGAETLLGNGDMLFLPPGTSTLVRAQGAYIRDEDINRVIAHICKQSPPNYLIPSFDKEGLDDLFGSPMEDDERDSLYQQALSIVMETGSASTTFLQRKLKIGYARAASIMDQLEEAGIVGPAEGAKPRKIMVAQKEGS